MKRILLYIIFLSSNIGLCQYQQKAGQPYTEPDLLIWKNDTIQIQTFPLYCWSKFDQNKLFGTQNVKPECWGCLKNYTAEWKIINDKLYLSNIYSFNFKKDSIKIDLNKLFPNKVESNLVFANWYSGDLFVPQGEKIWMSQSPGFPIYESEWNLTFKEGKIENKVFKTGNYHKSIYTQDPKEIVSFIDNHLDQETRTKLKNKRISILFKTGKSKKDYSVSLKGVDDKKLELKLINILKVLPDFDYYYRHGEELNLTIPLTYIDNRL